jgi:hypothetical protein
MNNGHLDVHACVDFLPCSKYVGKIKSCNANRPTLNGLTGGFRASARPMTLFDLKYIRISITKATPSTLKFQLAFNTKGI